MLGGIIGDLAASTYLRDPQVFYKQLFDDKATLSEYGMSILATVDYIQSSFKDSGVSCVDMIKSYFRVIDKNINLSDKASQWENEMSMRITPTAPGMMLNRLATYYEFHDFSDNNGWNVIIDSCADKEEGYANIILGEIITWLRDGKSKQYVLANVNGVFTQSVSSWNWKENETSLCLLKRAWECFYNSFDFGSAIHNAVRYPNSNTRQIASLTGLIAEAMYGCDMYFIKARFNPKQPEVNLEIPMALSRRYQDLIDFAEKERNWRNVFFPKNNSRTNVNRHIYSSFKSRFEGLKISPEIHRRILRSFQPSWDSRYSFYLDNGWVYLCRSFSILGRFKSIKCDGGYKLINIQQSDENPDFENGFEDAFRVVTYGWAIYGQLTFRYFSPWNESIKSICPEKYNDTKNQMFWEGEKEFYMTQMDNLGQWIVDGKQYISQLGNPLVIDKAKQLGQESFGVAYYIDQSFKRKYPSDKTNWIMEY